MNSNHNMVPLTCRLVADAKLKGSTCRLHTPTIRGVGLFFSRASEPRDKRQDIAELGTVPV